MLNKMNTHIETPEEKKKRLWREASKRYRERKKLYNILPAEEVARARRGGVGQRQRLIRLEERGRRVVEARGKGELGNKELKKKLEELEWRKWGVGRTVREVMKNKGTMKQALDMIEKKKKAISKIKTAIMRKKNCIIEVSLLKRRRDESRESGRGEFGDLGLWVGAKISIDNVNVSNLMRKKMIRKYIKIDEGLDVSPILSGRIAEMIKEYIIEHPRYNPYFSWLSAIHIDDVYFIEGEGSSPLESLVRGEGGVIESRYQRIEVKDGEFFIPSEAVDDEMIREAKECGVSEEALRNGYCSIKAIRKVVKKRWDNVNHTNMTFGMLKNELDMYLDKSGGIKIGKLFEWCQRKKFNMCIMDAKGEVIFEGEDNFGYQYPKLFGQVRNNHIYLYDKNINHLNAKRSLGGDEDDKLIISNKYLLTNWEKEKVSEAEENFVVESVDDCMTEAKKDDGKGKKVITILSRLLNEVFIKLVKDCKITPKIRLGGSRIISISFEVGNKSIKIIGCEGEECEDSMDDNTSADEMKISEELLRRVGSKMLCKNNLSYYSGCVKEIFNELGRKAIVGRLGGCGDKEVNIDRRKDYLHSLLSLKYFPVVCEFDDFEECAEDVEIDDYCFYIVEVEGELSGVDLLYLNAGYNLVLGKNWKEVRSEIEGRVKVVSCLRPSKFVRIDDIKDDIKQIYDEYSEYNDIVKRVINVVIGMTGKKFNKRENNLIFEDCDEAIHYYRKRTDNEFIVVSEGGAVEERRGWEVREMSDDDEVNTYELGENVIDVSGRGGRKLFVVKKEEKGEILKTGFYGVYHSILDVSSKKLFLLAKEVERKGVKVVGAWTDSITCVDDEKLKEWMKENEELKVEGSNWDMIGKLKIERKTKLEKEVVFRRKETFDDEITKSVKGEKKEVRMIKLDNEYDSESGIEKIRNEKRLVIKSRVAGSGKTYLVREYIKRIESEGGKGIVVCPTNQLVKKIKKSGVEGITRNKFFGIGVKESDKMKGIDISDIDVIVFEECGMDGLMWKGLQNELMEKWGDKQFIFVGDTKQTDPIEDDRGEKIKLDYEKVIDKMTGAVLILDIIKRCDEASRERNENIYKDFWIERKKIIDILRNFEVIKGIDYDSKYSIGFYNTTIDKVNNEIRKSRGKGDLFEIGDKIVCREYLGKAVKISINEVVEVVGEEGEKFVLRIEGGGEVKMSKNKVYNSFRDEWCYTGHSIQGITLDNSGEDEWITLYDVGDIMERGEEGRKLLYTMITRATNLHRIRISLFESERTELRKIFAKRISGYRSQDKKRGNCEDYENYVDVSWCMERLKMQKGRCSKCWCFLTGSDITVDRKDNGKNHCKGNCVLSCLNCNVSRKELEE